MVTAEGNGSEDIFSITGNDGTDRNLAIVGAVGRVESAAARVEANFSAQVTAKSGFQREGVELRGLSRGWRDILRHGVQNIFEDAGAGRKGERSQEKFFGSPA